MFHPGRSASRWRLHPGGSASRGVCIQGGLHPLPGEAEWQTGVKTLPYPKLRLRAVIICRTKTMHKFHGWCVKKCDSHWWHNQVRKLDKIIEDNSSHNRRDQGTKKRDGRRITDNTANLCWKWTGSFFACVTSSPSGENVVSCWQRQNISFAQSRRNQQERFKSSQS